MLSIDLSYALISISDPEPDYAGIKDCVNFVVVGAIDSINPPNIMVEIKDIEGIDLHGEHAMSSKDKILGEA